MSTVHTHTDTGRPYGEWFKSSYSSEQGTDCVEACPQPGTVYVRDSKQNAEGGPHLAFPLAAWTSFTQQIACRPPQ
ncbi:DUF397 domain-containing protein [Streptomyces flavofungini]|uniref:DUF397 domain-containing protein n=1 Tax=Streptomyces flavofungini TaxID=68200 RepID=UPI0025B02540|nr:DUF397 domain-containing protein [Streptomyces flavofungini]WJV51686.1 DUF397 domain-containing protein [Streptomyces flavofungini]